MPIRNPAPPTGWVWRDKFLYLKLPENGRLPSIDAFTEAYWAMYNWLNANKKYVGKESQRAWISFTSPQHGWDETYVPFAIKPISRVKDKTHVAWKPDMTKEDMKFLVTSRESRCRNCAGKGFSLYGNGLCFQCLVMCPRCNEAVEYTSTVHNVPGERGPVEACNNCMANVCPDGVRECIGCYNLQDARDVRMVELPVDPFPRRAHQAMREYAMCGDCADQRTCGTCNTLQGYVISQTSPCRTCKSRERMQKFTQYEQEFETVKPTCGMLVPDVPQRKVRPMSIETELDSDDKFEMASIFHTCGVVHRPEVMNYGFHPNLEGDEYNWPAFLKYDGSVTGGELVLPLFDPSVERDAERMEQVYNVCYAMTKDKLVETNPNCGGHMHIDAHRFGYQDVWRLMLLFGKFEDTIYRIAGAGNSYGHRSSVQGHDRANHGGGYAKQVTKGPFGTKDNLVYSVRSQERMTGLNMTIYAGAMGRCKCDAMRYDGDIKRCNCKLGKVTIEWRVFNSTTNPRILHAWIALMQSAHSWAERPIGENVTDEFERMFLPAREYTKKPIPEDKYADTISDLRWIFGNLFFTDHEKESLIYTIKNTVDFQPIEYNWDDLLTVPYVGQEKAYRSVTQQKIARNLRRKNIDAAKRFSEVTS